MIPSSFLSSSDRKKTVSKTRPIRIDESTIKKLDSLGKKLCEDEGFKDPSYTQIIEYMIKKAEKK
jgi:hypothetical protein